VTIAYTMLQQLIVLLLLHRALTPVSRQMFGGSSDDATKSSVPDDLIETITNRRQFDVAYVSDNLSEATLCD